MDDLSTCTILIVDDTETNIDVLIDIFADHYQVLVAMNGESALKIASSEYPDLILLDIMMPGMDGYEVCRKLKEDEKTRSIPIIFITAKSDDEDEAKGLTFGAIDYLRKPVNPPIVMARIKNHLKLKLAQEKLKAQNEILKENVRLREDLENISRHDLKSPLTPIISLPSVIKEVEGLQEREIKYLSIIENAGYKILEMINRSSDLLKMENGNYRLNQVPVDLSNIVMKIFEDMQNHTKSFGASFKVLIHGRPYAEEDEFIVLGEKLLCYSMLANIIKNAIEASPNECEVSVSMEYDKFATIRIHNIGPVREDMQERFFEKYATSGKEFGTGLGTYSARLIAEIQGGSISMDTSEEKGTLVTILLPK